jgi:hypothetical protein
MAGVKKPLTPGQQVLLASVRTKHAEKLRIHAEAEQRVRAEVQAAKLAAELDEAFAVRRAFEAGIPKLRIGQEGLGTRDFATVTRVLDKTKRMQLDPSASETPSDVFEWADREAGEVKVHYRNFPTTATDEHYAEIIEGVVRQSDTARNGWEVVKDIGDVSTGFGTLPGWLTFEINDVDKTTPFSLTGMLDEWAAANR